MHKKHSMVRNDYYDQIIAISWSKLIDKYRSILYYTSMALSIFSYIDYRKYLADFYSEAKREHTFFSYQYMAARVGIDASNLAKVLIGKRHIPKKSLVGFRRLCMMDDREFEYFACIVEWARARSETVASQLFERMAGLQGAQPCVLDALQFEYYRHWYHAAIYALLDIVDFRGNFRRLVSLLRPQVSIEQVKASVELLLKLGLVLIDENGRYVPQQKALSTGERWKSYAVLQFQRETAQLAIQALDNMAQKERDISTLTFSASEEDLIALKKLTRDYRRSVMDLISNSTGANRVWQLNCQIFPVSVPGGTSE